MSSAVRTRRRIGRRSLAAATAVAATSLSLVVGLTSPAAAAGDRLNPNPRDLERGEAYMGAGIRLHEGTGAPAGSAGAAGQEAGPLATVEGVDVSSHQGNVNWSTLWNAGNRFAYVKATEGTSYKNPYFAQQYNGSYNVGMIRGAYHFALPNGASGAAQADYFASNGGGWSRDGKTLPGVLDIEYNPYGATCYGLSQASMRSWISSFLTRYRERTGRYAVIYTNTNWWTQCTGNYGGYAGNHPLWIARYASSPGTLPAGWGFYTFWQYTSTGPTVGDHNKFNGAYDRLQALANG
ncbi:lysozyme [Streptomyces sp. NBC_01808]|uniref:lysozyme n=1 Tax=Streptomyces sp. NBC_01808 TaxID=2975947 RepID=UPI002DD85615|nr:lysozyme [Streptomyces sp. NBC_01808]WSA40565.1 lysozyme [Streptomyces sp. NBC_01808]